MTYQGIVTYHLIEGILDCENDTKQKLGQKFARYLNLTPGPLGPDDGVDGSTTFAGKKIHFQSKLSRKELDVNEAKLYYSDIRYHKVDISIMLSGRGYKKTFHDRLNGYEDIKKVKIHLLTLQDVIENSEAFLNACCDLPNLEMISSSLLTDTNI
ncbi:restriction endonuclease [Synechococcus elongatus]|uniref:restriction endonuclease n=1 Tax=Synechococcus elongatus TaxID=32046 RepID=UPI000F7F9C5D|nr:restriction endonuclease [Synechococcus elongatus]